MPPTRHARGSDIISIYPGFRREAAPPRATIIPPYGLKTRLKDEFPPSFTAAESAPAVYETHKFGGYPTYTQDNGSPDGFTYVMQVGYDFEAGLELGDCGSYYFYYNAEKNEWRVHFDCY